MGVYFVNQKNNWIRKAGILLHPSSLPNQYGIGDLGPSAFFFIDFLAASNQKIWQILPLGPIGLGNSPYHCFSSFAGNIYLISPEFLVDLELLQKEDLKTCPDFNAYLVDYKNVIKWKNLLFQKAYEQFIQKSPSELTEPFIDFCAKEKNWIQGYGLFMALKDKFEGRPWNEWPSGYQTCSLDEKIIAKYKEKIKFHQFLQFLFFTEWNMVKKYANQRGIEIIGDLPIFVPYDSADVWCNQKLFSLDETRKPKSVSGVPPDYFSAAGQVWGTPLYSWKKHMKSDYTWWFQRIKHSLKIVDILRIDHFRAFESYWAIPWGSKTAIDGKWKKGPGKDFFTKLQLDLGNLPIVAEDLGIITDEVRKLRDAFDLPGMRVLQFGFENMADNDQLPHHLIQNCIVYTGTHDNNTTLGWYFDLSEVQKDRIKHYLGVNGSDICWDMIRAAYRSIAKICIIPLQDIFGFGSDTRMNMPGTAKGNWQWRFTSSMLTSSISEKLKSFTQLYGR